MKRVYLYPMFLLVFVSLACSVGGLLPGGNNEVVRPTDAPTSTPVPDKSSEASLYDDFSTTQEGWSDQQVITTQAKMGNLHSSASVVDGKLVFDLEDNETYMYKFYTHPAGEDVAVEVSVQSFEQITNGIALVCRATNEYDKWYEFRVSSTNNYAIYSYDASRRDEEKNPYVELKKGGLRIDQFRPTKENVIRGVCQGSTLTLYINDNEIASATAGDSTGGELVGLGAISYDILPVTVKFDYFSYGTP